MSFIAAPQPVIPHHFFDLIHNKWLGGPKKCLICKELVGYLQCKGLGQPLRHSPGVMELLRRIECIEVPKGFHLLSF
jgi:hypothetical protein